MRAIRFHSASDTDSDRVDEMTARLDARDVRIVSGTCCAVTHQCMTNISRPNIAGLIAAKTLADNMAITTNIDTKNLGEKGFDARPEFIGRHLEMLVATRQTASQCQQ